MTRRRASPVAVRRPSRSRTSVAESPREDLRQLISFQLRQLVTVFIKGSGRIYGARFGLTLNEWRLIALLHASGELSMRRLASQAQFDQGLTSRLVTSLVERGYFRRRADVRDGRGILVSLTPAGIALVSQVFPVARARNEQLLSSLTPAERRALFRIVQKLTHQALLMLQETDESKIDPPGSAAR